MRLLVGRLSTKTRRPDREPRCVVLPCGDSAVFSRDCAHYEFHAPGGTVLHVLVNHFSGPAAADPDEPGRPPKSAASPTG